MASHEATPGTITPESRRMADALSQRAERLGEKLDTLGEGAKDIYARGKERAHVWGDEVSSYVQDQPVKSVLIAVGVGLLLGALLARR